MSAAFAAAALLAQGVAAPMLALNALVLGDCIPPNRLHAHRQLRARQFTNELESRLIADLEAAPAGTRAVVIDVGANNGYWSRSWFEIQQKATRDGKQLDVFMIEPQPHFLEALTKQARECNATFIPAAASTVKGHAVFETERPGSDRARLAHMDGHAGIDGKTRTTHRVQTIDLAAFVLDQLAPRRTKTHAGTEKDARHRAGERRPAPKAASLSLMKLDVEGHEYHLLPALIASGALCRVRYLIQAARHARLSARRPHRCRPPSPAPRRSGTSTSWYPSVGSRRSASASPSDRCSSTAADRCLSLCTTTSTWQTTWRCQCLGWPTSRKRIPRGRRSRAAACAGLR